MLPYFLLVALPVIIYVISQSYKVTVGNKVIYETQKAPINMFMLIFLLMLALRGIKCGVDTVRYLDIYDVYSSNSFLSLIVNLEKERGFAVFSKLTSLIIDDFQFFLGMTALVCIWPLWNFYKKESENQLLTIALFLAVAPFMMYFSGIRQAMAMALGFPAWYAAKDKKILKFIIIVLVAIQFHNSAFMLFLIYPLYYTKITTRWLWFVVPGIFVVFMYRVPIFMFLIRFLWEEYETTPETGATTVLILLILFAVYSYVIPNEKTLNDDDIALRNILLLSVVIQIFAMIHPLSMRMNYYFLIFIPVLIPKIIKKSKKSLVKITQLSSVIMTVYFMYYFINKVVNDIDALSIFPYIPFWKN